MSLFLGTSTAYFFNLFVAWVALSPELQWACKSGLSEYCGWVKISKSMQYAPSMSLFLVKGCLPMFAIEGSWKLKRDGATSRHLLGYRIPMLDGRTHSWKRHLRTPNIVIGRRRTKTKLSPRKLFYFHLISISEWRPVAALSNFPQKCFSILTGFQSKLQKLQNNFDCSSLLWQFWHIPWIKLGSIWIGSWSRSRVSRVAEVWQ